MVRGARRHLDLAGSPTRTRSVATGGTGADFAHESTDSDARGPRRPRRGLQHRQPGCRPDRQLHRRGTLLGRADQSRRVRRRGPAGRVRGTARHRRRSALSTTSTTPNTTASLSTRSPGTGTGPTTSPSAPETISTRCCRRSGRTWRPAGPTDSPPTVTITSPADGATVSAAVTVTADASDDDGVDHVEFFVDNDSIEVDTDGVDGWSATWDTTWRPRASTR